jgi:stearoyl-CoA desaturase (delta-9 desaturase)
MHRLLIHRSFRTPLFVEHALVYLGTLVGMAGPFGMIYAHDIRDWAQRQKRCHDLHAHRRPFFIDAFWQMHCAVALRHPPRFEIEPSIRNDRFYRFLERTWMWQQLPWAILFYLLGGWGWVVWGIAVRVSVSLTGHWLVGHFAHRRGQQGWAVDHVAVQGYDLPRFGLVTFGESFHGNHHAFPESARLGLEPGQVDLGWALIRTLSALGLARDVKLPENTARRAGLRRVGSRETLRAILGADSL